VSELAYIGVGTNIEPRLDRMRIALTALGSAGSVLKVSSIYETAPYGVQEQSPFLNAVAALVTEYSPAELHARLKELELQLGRQKRERWYEREIDFDILFYGNVSIQTSELIIPHADLLNRSFVLIPLREIAPNAMHPVLRRTIEDLSAPFVDTPIEALHKINDNLIK
jgi:2-amino-4-hydroxy-6-hydroxymethyldihydropteridine diphosphokinase